MSQSHLIKTFGLPIFILGSLLVITKNESFSQGGPAAHVSVSYTPLPKKCSPLSGDIIALIAKGPNTQAIKYCNLDNTWSDIGSGAMGPTGPSGPSGPVGPSGPSGTYVFGATFTNSGNDITTGAVSYKVSPVACTIKAFSIWVDTPTTVHFDVWKNASGTAIPTIADSILPVVGGSPVYIAQTTGTRSRGVSSTFLSTMSVAVNDMLGFELQAVGSGVKVAHIELECQ